MAGGPYYERKPGSLKEAVQQLVTACGGPERAAAASARVSSERVKQYTSETGKDLVKSHAPVDIIERWERASGQPIVTRWLAQAQGAALITLRGDAVTAESYAAFLARIGREAGDVVGGVADALANGTVDKTERASIRRELGELMTQCSALMARLDREDRRD